MNILVKGMKMPLNCIVCPMQFGGMCYVQPPEVDDPRVAPTVDQCVSRASWCPLVEIPDGHGTNADRIREMTDEELAKKISGLESFAITCDFAWPPDKWLEWLKKEVET